jgi:hypothetical protein
MTALSVGQRVAHRRHRALGTVAYVRPDRIGIAWDDRDFAVYPAQPHEVVAEQGDAPEGALAAIARKAHMNA